MAKGKRHPMEGENLPIRNSTAEFLTFVRENGADTIAVRFQDEMLWLTLNGIAELFGVDKSVASRICRTFLPRKSFPLRQLLQNMQRFVWRDRGRLSVSLNITVLRRLSRSDIASILRGRRNSAAGRRACCADCQRLSRSRRAPGEETVGTSDAPQTVRSATPPYWWKSGVWGVPSPMPEGERQTVGIKLKWYDKIEQGLKHEEFREKGPYWDARLGGRKGRNLRAFTFMKGRASKVQMTWEVAGVEGRGNWYVINLGKRIA